MPTIPIRWADNTKELQANLRAGLNQIEATRAGAERMVKSLSGDKLLGAAHQFAAAVQQLGGVEKLTNAERARGNTLLTKALEKYQALGQQAPTALRELASATSGATEKANVLAKSIGALAGAVTAGAILNLGRQILADADALQRMHDVTGISVEGLQRLQVAADDSGNWLFRNSRTDSPAATVLRSGRLGNSDCPLRTSAG
jgi:hypothetical protein